MPHKFLINVDAQVDFIMRNGLLAIKGAERIIAPMIYFLTMLDPKEYAGALFTYDTHQREIYEKSEEAKQFNLHCEKGTPGWELVAGPNLVSPHIPTFTLEKGVFDMWKENDLRVVSYETPAHPVDVPRLLINRHRDIFFQELKERGIDTITVIGVAADFCVKDAIAGLLERGFKVEIIRDLTTGIVRDIDQTVAEEFSGRVQIL